MKKLDFLNSSPTYYIFNEETNKTNFGGVLFLIYLIIMFFISLVYIYDFASNEKYEIESYTANAINKYYKNLGFIDIEYNPILNQTQEFILEIVLHSENKSQINEIIDNTIAEYKGKQYKAWLCPKSNYLFDTLEHFDTKILFNITANIIDDTDRNFIDIYYICKDYNCTNYPNKAFYYLIINTKDFELKHDESNPIISQECLTFWGLDAGYPCQSHFGNLLYDNQTLTLNIKLFSIIYEDKKGISRVFDKIFNKKNNYSISYIQVEGSEIFFDDD